MIALPHIPIQQIIKENFNRLSSGQRKVAEHILHNLHKAAINTAEQIGREINVSQTTVIRLSYALGFSGFSEMQDLIQKQVLSVQETRESGAANQHITSFANILEQEISMLEEFKSQVDAEQIWQAVNWLIEADQVLVVGHGTSSAPALWLSIVLNEVRDHVHINSSTTDTFNQFLSLSDKSVVFMISYPRYAKHAIKLAESAKVQGAKIIAATDQILSPAGRVADLTFITKTHAQSGTNSMVALHSLLNVILFGMNEKLWGEIQTRRIKLEEYYSNFNIFDE